MPRNCKRKKKIKISPRAKPCRISETIQAGKMPSDRCVEIGMLTAGDKAGLYASGASDVWYFTIEPLNSELDFMKSYDE